MGKKTKITIETYKTVIKAIAESDSLDMMSNHLTQLLSAALSTKACAIYLLDLETKQLELLASFGLTPAYLGKGSLRADKSLFAEVSSEPVIVSDIQKCDMIQYPDEARQEGIAAIVNIPIKFRGGVLGSLRLYHQEIWEISEEDVNSLELLAETVGLAMTCASLFNAVSSIEEIIKHEIPFKLLA